MPEHKIVNELLSPDWRVCVTAGVLQGYTHITIQVGGNHPCAVVTPAYMGGSFGVFAARAGEGGATIFQGSYEELEAFVEENKNNPDVWRWRDYDD